MSIRAALFIVCVSLSVFHVVLAQSTPQSEKALTLAKPRLNLTDQQTKELRKRLGVSEAF